MMTRRTATLGIASTAAIATLSQPAAPAVELPALELPAPRHQGGKPLMEALTLRRSIRAYDAKPLPPQLLSDLLWAANGVNRPATGDRTAPYWRHIMVIDALPEW